MVPEDRFPPRLRTFADRLIYVRVFVARYKHSKEMADRLGYAPSTYATWEEGSAAPRDKVAVAERIAAEFADIPTAWLLTGNDVLFPYRDNESDFGHTRARTVKTRRRAAVNAR